MKLVAPSIDEVNLLVKQVCEATGYVLSTLTPNENQYVAFMLTPEELTKNQAKASLEGSSRNQGVNG